jgi:hypothetical protein
VTGVKMADSTEGISGLQEKAGKQTFQFSIMYQFSTVDIHLDL